MNTFKRLFQRWRSRQLDRRIVLGSGLFDPDYYLKRYPDVAMARIDPLQHYVDHGRFEGRAPSAEFDPSFYLESNPDVRQLGLDPFIHYIMHGRPEKRPPHSPRLATANSLRHQILASGLFDPEFYRTAYLDVALSGADPLQHYLAVGRDENRRPSADFDPVAYLAENTDVQREGVNPFIHYIEMGRAEGRRLQRACMSSVQIKAAIHRIKESGLFDKEYYLLQCPVVRDAHVDPLLHYLIGGMAPFVDPSPSFSSYKYIRAHPIVANSLLNPLVHHLESSCISEPLQRQVHTPDRPNDLVSFEIKAGDDYFRRFRFPIEGGELGSSYLFEAVAGLATLSPQLTIESIQPDVSIIIPVFGQLQFALSCLDSLSRQRSRYTAEIIISDDDSPADEQTARLQAIPWIRYRKRSSNGGYLDNCNDAAHIARGRFLIFLNSDTRVVDGWLDELIDSFDLFPKAGLIGSRLFSSDGALQEAGGIYWSDGSAWNYGRDDDGDHPKYCFARHVDYVSGASIAVPAAIWHLMGGFDPVFRPAYCEDADLAFRLREAGYEVWLQPLSRIVHYEGRSHGRDLDQGVKRHQTINMRRFAERWRSTLAGHGPNGQTPDREANREVRDRILVLDAVTPTPDQDSGSFITFRMLKALKALGYQPTFVPQHNYVYERSYTSALQRLGIECLYRPYFRNISDVLDYRENFDIVLAYRHNVLDPVYAELRRRMPAARIIFHNVDLHFLREEREAALYGSGSKRVSAAITRAAELELIAKVDCTIVHTNAEVAVIKKYLPVENIVVFRYISELHKTSTAFEERHDVMFLGGFNHPPNVDAVKHFARVIWPGLAERLPDCARLLIVGPSAPAEIKSLEGVRVIVKGYAADLQPCFDSSRVFVAPIRYGAGIKGKVIQSLSYGTPSVMTSIAAEGIGLVSGRDALVVDDDAAFAESVMTLYSDKELWLSLQSAGYKFVEENFSWKGCLDLTTQALRTADAVWLARHERASHDRLNSLVSQSYGLAAAGGKESESHTWVPPGHFYSPIVDPKNPHVAATLEQFAELELPQNSGIAIDQEKMIAFFTRISRHYHRLPFAPKKQPPLHYYYENPFFSYGDGIMLGLMSMQFRPSRIIEIGSGFSSAAMIDMNDKLLGGNTDLTFVDPFPERLLGILPLDSQYRENIIREPVQSIPLETFDQLKADDVLFVDSAHVCKMASDVNHLIFNVFPRLQPGVVIHVHDVFYPFEYPPAWILQNNRSWNEAYLLRAFLQFNPSFEILFFNHFAVRKFASVIQSRTPLFLKNGGGSIWMRRVAQSEADITFHSAGSPINATYR